MPWTPSEATEHTKKATTPKLKRIWANAANAALSAGHDDAAALRIAAAAVAKAAGGRKS